MNALLQWAANNRPFLFFLGRFLITFFGLSFLYSLYLVYVERQGDLDLVTYWISRGSHELARFLGVADCEWACFMDGCYVGRPGPTWSTFSKGCNGLTLGHRVCGVCHRHRRMELAIPAANVPSDLVVVQIFNVIRIGSLIALRDGGGDHVLLLL